MPAKQTASLLFGMHEDASETGAEQAGRFDYLLLSDVHLGSDLVTHVRPWAASAWLAEEAEIDERLVSMLDHQRRIQAPERLLRVIIAGDFLELVGVALPPNQVKTLPTREERLHGLGSAADHVVAKVRAIAARHPRVFRALMELVRAGHELILVRGNHDIELHWRTAQRAFVDEILAHADPDLHGSLRRRISIHPWFFLVPGLLYVEHGHQFDAMCSYGDPLLPTCPRDPRRIRQVPFSVLLRNVARPTRGLSTSSYENVSFGAYLGLLVKLGFRGSVGIALRFARAASRLLGEWTSHIRGEHGRRRHEARVRKTRFALRHGLTTAQLAVLEAMHARPAVCSLTAVLRSLYLDRILALALAAFCVVAGAWLARYRDALDGVLCALPAMGLGAYACVGNRDLSPTHTMRVSAGAIARMFGVRWVAMGHTHEPGVHPLHPGAQYINLGHWGEDDLPEERSSRAPRCPSTYLEIRRVRGEYQATLMRWDLREGPVRACLDSAAMPAEGEAACLLSLALSKGDVGPSVHGASTLCANGAADAHRHVRSRALRARPTEQVRALPARPGAQLVTSPRCRPRSPTSRPAGRYSG